MSGGFFFADPGTTGDYSYDDHNGNNNGHNSLTHSHSLTSYTPRCVDSGKKGNYGRNSLAFIFVVQLLAQQIVSSTSSDDQKIFSAIL